MLVHPGKCQFNLQSVEYLGHVIDKDGLHFAEAKLRAALDFPIPEIQSQLKAFLGFGNYFRDHISNYSALTAPLEALMTPYQPKKPLNLTTASKQAFQATQQAIANCPKLFFIDSHSDVYLHTDASDGGIGAYLFQIVNGKRQPIQFVSKALSKSQKKWSTPEKECYAIFHTLHKLDYLLHDIPFVIRTDHRNLTFLNKNGSPKVIRWKLDIQEFDFQIEYIPGPDNVEADEFSRMDYNNAMHLSLIHI